MPAPLPPRAAQPYVPAAPGSVSESQMEARKALCGGVQFALTRVRRRHWKAKALDFAMQSYHGQGGSRSADQAITGALEEYGRGMWDETQCPPSTGGRLPKGAIAQVMR
jgi:hypothetical protein